MSDALAVDRENLLSDAQVLDFIAQGYHIVEPQFPTGFNASICAQIDALESSPGNEILAHVPMLQEVYDHPQVSGPLASLLGEDFQMDGHRALHVNAPGSRSQTWHQDGTNVRHHQVWCVLAMYYPHDVPAAMGPTIIMPGTHFRNAPTDQLATYANIKGQVPLTVNAGTVAITHYDLWHAATRNKTAQKRYMLKFLFNRVSAPHAPSWNHQPETAASTARTQIRKMVGIEGYNSDYYKEWELRKEMWDWIKGEDGTVPPGEFRNMLS